MAKGQKDPGACNILYLVERVNTVVFECFDYMDLTVLNHVGELVI